MIHGRSAWEHLGVRLVGHGLSSMRCAHWLLLGMLVFKNISMLTLVFVFVASFHMSSYCHTSPNKGYEQLN